MKTTKSIFTIATLALTVGLFLTPLTADAGRFRGACSGAGANMIDTDGDGIGDTRPARGTGMGTNAANFIDVDGNGVCDNYEAGGQHLQDGSEAGTTNRYTWRHQNRR